MNQLDSYRGSTQFEVTEQTEHIFYLYIFDCESEFDKSVLKGTVQITIDMDNNGS